jgi:type II secretion system protein N
MRLLRVIGIPLAGVLLVAFFIYWGFPYDRLATRIEMEAGRALDARVEIQEIGPRLALLGPGFQARGVRALWRDGRTLELDRAAVRPAWSLSWLRGHPALYAELEGPPGALSGTWSRDGAWQGELDDVDLSALPLATVLPGAGAQGRLNADVDLRVKDALPEGTVTFQAHSGSLQLPNLPMPIPFETLEGDLVFGDESSRVQVNSLSLSGPVLSASGQGTVGRAERFAQAPLDLSLEIQARQEGVQSLLRSAGLQLDRKGSARLRISGSVRAPQVR